MKKYLTILFLFISILNYGQLDTINIGTAPNDGTGESLRSGMIKVNIAIRQINTLTTGSTNWNTAYTDRLKWDGGATGLTAATGRTSLGATTVGAAFFMLTNPGAITFPRINADNSITALSAANFKTALSLTSTDVGLNNLTNKAQVELEDSVNYPSGYMSRYDGINGLAGKQDNPINYYPTIINFGNTTQQYDITGTTWVASSDGTPNAVGHLLPATLIAMGTAYDDEYLSIRENTGVASATNPLTVQFTFPSVATFNVIKFRTWYNGSASHQLTFELYNGVDWDAFITESNENALQVHTAEVLVPAPYIIGGNVVGRFRHEQTGNAAHYLMIDFIVIASGGGEGGASIQTAFQTPSTATGTIAATNVQDAIAELETEKLNLSDSVNYTKGYMSRYDGVTGLASKVALADSNVWAGGYVTPKALSDSMAGITPAGSVALADSNVWDGGYVTPKALADSMATVSATGAVMLADSVNYTEGYMTRYDGVTGLALKLNKADSALMTGGYFSYSDGVSGLASKLNKADSALMAGGYTSYADGLTKMAIADSNSHPIGYVTWKYLVDALAAAVAPLEDTVSLETIVQLNSDSAIYIPFLMGSGQAGDTALFNDGALCGSFYNYKDTLVAVYFNGVMSAGTGTETMTIDIKWHATFQDGSAVELNSTPLTITSLTTGTTDVSFNNSIIPPGVRVWGIIAGIDPGNRPSYFEGTLVCYKLNRSY